MTLHILLPTAEPHGLVWVTDSLFSLGFDATACIEKISHLANLNAACSAWGIGALVLREELIKWLRHRPPSASDPDSVLLFLREFSQNVIQRQMVKLSDVPRENPGVILATFSEARPRLYCCKISMSPPTPFQAESLVCIGDEESPARVFVEHYYETSEKNTEKVLFLGIHAMRIAHIHKAAFIGEPRAWVYRDNSFERLPAGELANFIEASRHLDLAIASYPINSPIVHT